MSPEEVRVGEAALAAFAPGKLLYARVDVVPDPTGRLRIMELELIEPSLFFQQFPPAVERFAEGIRARS